ncbi:MAG: PAS domain S-box protein [Chloroflexota bacterium]
MAQENERSQGMPQLSLALSAALEGLKPHDHLCLIYETWEEWREAVVPFIAIGLKRGEKCIYIADTSTAEQVKGYLSQEGIDSAAAEQKGQLVVLSHTEAYTREGSFDPDRMISLLIEATKQAVAEGYPALRATGEMTWALRGLPGSEKLIEYESKLNHDVFPHYPCLAICQYDRWKFDPEVIKGVLMTHPMIVRGARIYRNFYYIPPEEFVHHKRVEREVQHLLNNLERERMSQERVRFFANLLNMSSQPVVVSDPNRRLLMWNSAFARLIRYTDEELCQVSSYLRLTPPEWQGTDEKAVDEIKRTGQPQRYEKEYLRRDGSRLPVEIFRHVVRDAAGNIEYFFSFITDITDRRLAQRELRLSEARYRELFENMSNCVAVYEARDNGNDFIFIGFNRTAERVEQIRREEVLGRSVLEVFPGVKDFGLFDVFQRVWRTGAPEYHPAAEYKDQRITGWRENYVYRLPSGEVVAIYEDVTKRKQTEETLKESEERYRSVVENANDAIISWDTGDRIVAWNKAAERMYGYTAAEAIGLFESQMIAESHRKLHQEGLRRAVTTGKLTIGVRTTSGMSLKKDGTEFPVEIGITLTRIGGRPVFTGIVRDITERKRAEDQIRYQASLLDQVSDAIVSADLEGRIQSWNKGAERMFGWLAQEVIGKTGPEALGTEYIGITRDEAIRRTMADGVWDGEIIYHHRNGSRIHTQVSRSLVRDQTGKPISWVGVVRDITTLKQAEERLRHAAEQWQSTFDSVNDGICLMNSESVILRCNRAMSRITGKDESQLVGHHYWEVVHDTSKRPELCPFIPMLKSRARETAQWQFTGRWYEVTVDPILDPDGNLVGAVHIMSNITERKKLADTLARSEAHFRGLIETAGAGVATADLEGNLTLVNDTTCRMLGYSRRELLGKPFADFIHPDDVSKILQVFRGGVSDTRTSPHLEFRAIRKDGGTVWWYTSPMPLTESGRTVGIAAILQDITQRRQAEDALRASEERLNAVINSASDAIVTFDSDGIIMSWNQAAERLFGYTADEIIGQKFAVIILPRRLSAEENWRKMKEAVRQGRLLEIAGRSVEATGRHKDGNEFPAEHSLSLWKAARQTFFTAIIRDITQRKKAKELFRLLAEKAPVGVWIAIRRQYRYVNSMLVEYTGYSEAELLRTKRKDLIWPEDHDRVMLWSHDVSHGKTSLPIEYRLKRKDGGFRWVLEMCGRINYDGKPATRGTCIDITQYREAERRAIEYEQIARTRGEVLSLVSHELRTPLAAIKGYSTMLLDYEKKLSAREKREQLVLIDQSANRLKDMVDLLLDTSRLEAGLMTLNKRSADIGQIIKEAVSEIQLSVKGRRFPVRTGARPLQVEIDQKRIRQVLDNLLDNAVKYSEKGTEVTITAHRKGDEVVVSVADRGQGIPAEELPHLFDRAHGLKKRLSPGTAGLGLGLNLCKGLVEAHGGRIWAESKLGKGSTFHFALPVKGT